MSIRVVTKSEQVCREIMGQIFRRVLKPGQRLVEAQLSKEFGVSQATVNAALQDLHEQGLVTKLLNRSTRVNRYTREQIENLFAVRRLLEPAAAEAVSRVWDEKAERTLTEPVEQMRRAARSHDLSRFCLADYTFHQELYRLSRNSFFIQACQAIAVAPFAYILCDHPGALPTDYLALAEDHNELILAMREGPEQAGRMMRERIENWLQHSIDALAAYPAAAS
jgi:DNA-binding GntR family transcriptional regulator